MQSCALERERASENIWNLEGISGLRRGYRSAIQYASVVDKRLKLIDKSPRLLRRGRDDGDLELWEVRFKSEATHSPGQAKSKQARMLVERIRDKYTLLTWHRDLKAGQGECSLQLALDQYGWKLGRVEGLYPGDFVKQCCRTKARLKSQGIRPYGKRRKSTLAEREGVGG